MGNQRSAWNKGRLLGQKPPLKPNEIWSVGIRLQLADKAGDLALFNVAIDSKLRGCDPVSLRVRMCIKAVWFRVVRSSCSARPRSRKQPGSQSLAG
jgi:hypothetical protein